MDYKQARATLTAINAYVQLHPSLQQHFTYAGYNVLQALQHQLFSILKRPVPSNTSQTWRQQISTKGLFIVAWLLNQYTSWRSRKGVDCLVYSVDLATGRYGNDRRIEGLYEYLHDANLNYREVWHTRTLGQLLKNLWRRKRVGFYLIGFPVRPKVAEPELIASVPAPLAERFDQLYPIMLSYHETLVAQTEGLRTVVQRLQPDSVYMIDDPRYYHSLLIAAAEQNIPTYAIQHGHLTKYHVGWLDMQVGKGEIIKPDHMVVWSEYWKQELLRLGTYFAPEQLLVGNARAAVTVEAKQPTGDRLNVLIPYETDAPHTAVKAYIDKILALPKAKVYFKVRPDIAAETQLREYNLTASEQVVVVTDLRAVQAKIDVVLGVYSTFLYDMVELGLPVGILETDMDYGYGMVENDLSSLVRLDSVAADVDTVKNAITEASDRAGRLTAGTQPLRAILQRN